MNNSKLFINIDDKRWESVLPDYQALSEQSFNNVLAYIFEHEDFDVLLKNKNLSVNLSLSNDDEVHKLNKEFRNIDKPTNVLSFANIDDEDFDNICLNETDVELGDIIIAVETMQKESSEQRISFKDHYCHLLVHGLLHLLGYDHQTDEEADYMEGLEIKILQLMNIENPYKELF